MTYTKKQVLPALHKSRRLQKPDMPDVEQQNYTSTVLKYANLSLPFPQLDTNAKRVVPAINELWNNRVIANPPIPSTSYQIESEDGYIIISEDEYIIEADGEGGGDIDPLNTIKIDGIIYKIVGGSGVSYLKDLKDVKLQSLSDGQILRYDSATERWINVDGGGEYTAGAGIYFTGENDSIINADAGRKSRGKNALTFRTEWHYDTSLPDWEDTYTTIDDHIVYQSLGGTYQQTSGESLGTYTVAGATKFTIHLKQDVEDSRYSYVVLGRPNEEINLSTGNYEKSYRGEDIPDYVDYEYDGLNSHGGIDTIQVMFHKEEPPHPTPIGVTLDLNNGQWRDTETTIEGNEVYESDQGSWHIDNGASVCTIYINGITSISINVSQSSEYYYDYCYIGNIDEPVSTSNYRNNTYGVGAGYITFTYNCSPEQHFIQLMYAKDGSSYSGEDRGYFYYVVNSMDESGATVNPTSDSENSSDEDRAWIYAESSEPYIGEHGEVFNDYDNNYATGDYAHAEGSYTTAIGDYSHAEGSHTTAIGASSHAEGLYTTASDYGAHAEGNDAIASGHNSHAEGEGSIASAEASHAEGHQTQAVDKFTHAEGYMNIASAQCAHAEGNNTIASGENSHTEGRQTQATNIRAHAEGGYTLASGSGSHAEGEYTVASGTNSHAEGYYSKAQKFNSHAEGYETIASGEDSHSENHDTKATGNYSHSEGYGTEAIGDSAHAEGHNTIASGAGSHAEGYGGYGGQYNTATGIGSHAEGSGNLVSGNCGHAEGTRNTVYSESGHADGSGNQVYGHESHATGSGNTVSEQSGYVEGAGNRNIAFSAHVEGAGNRNTYKANISHTEGAGNTNYGYQAHAEGSGNRLSGEESHVEGAGNMVHGPKTHGEGGGNIAYTIGGHIEGKHNVAVGFGTHAEGIDNCIGYGGTPGYFSYGFTYAVGDIVGANANYVNYSEADKYLLYRCITAPGQIQASSNINIVTPTSWDSSTTYQMGSIVQVSGIGFYYNPNSVSTNQNPVLGSPWVRITNILSPFKTSGSGYYLLDCEEASGANKVAVVYSGTVQPMWEPITTSSGGHIEGIGNISTGDYQHVQGKYNTADATKAFIIGNGSDGTHRSNALTVDWSGNMAIAGDLTPGVTLSTTAQTIGAAINELAAGGGGGGSTTPIPDTFIYSLFS